MGILKIKHILLTLIAFILFGSVAIPFPVMATPQSDAGFSVRAKLPDNQLDKNLTYFDLRMLPEQEQQLEVEITNQLDIPLLINAETISASTNRHGIIDYTTPAIYDKTLQVPFSRIATMAKTSIIVPARSSETAIIDITMPEESFDGIILGGLVFTRENEGPKETSTTTINNIFSYVIGVKLSENDVVVMPQFELANVAPATVNYRPEFVHEIRNTQAAIVKGIDIIISVEDQHGMTWAKTNKTNIDMAPNSNMPLGIASENGKFKAGKYTSTVLIKYNEEIFTYQRDFVITAAQADSINDEIITESPTINLQHILLALLMVVIVLILSLVWLIQKQRKAQKGATHDEI